MPRWRRATVVWLRPDATRPDLAYLPFEHVNTDMIYATTVTEIVARHKAFVRKWRLKCPAVAASLEEAGARLLHYPPEQWKSLRTRNAVERLHEEFKRRIKAQCLLPAPRLLACCSGRCSRAARSACAASTAETPSTFRRPNSTLIAPPERTNIANGRCAVSLSYHLRDTTRSCIKVGSGQVNKIRFGADRVGLIQIGTLSECHFSLV
jgi:hypothetical protein